MKTLKIANDLLLPEVVRLLDEGHSVTLPLRGYSMRPFLEDGRDKALLKHPEKIEVGDEVYYLTDLGICWGKVEKVVSTDTNITFYKLKRDRRLRSRVFSSREALINGI